MAVNKQPFLKNNITGEARPFIFPGKVQAGSTQEIKRGEICAYNETSGYWVPVDAVADAKYSLAIANEEQKSDGLARYMEFMGMREGDVFEFELDASAQVEIGDPLTLTASNSQKLTSNADGQAVAVVANIDNYPEIGTTLGYRSYAQVMFLPHISYFYKNLWMRNLKKVVNVTANTTLKLEDCGALFHNSGASGGVTLTAPNGVVPIGWWFRMVCKTADNFIFDPKPDTAKCVIKGGQQTAGLYAQIADEGDFIEWTWDGTDWIADASISGADGDITIETP